jgi:hypothetical protein
MPSGRTERPLDRCRAPAAPCLTPPSMSTYGERHVSLYAPSPFARAPSRLAATTLLRRLTWKGTVSVKVRVKAKDLPTKSARGLECYYLQAPRVLYRRCSCPSSNTS